MTMSGAPCRSVTLCEHASEKSYGFFLGGINTSLTSFLALSDCIYIREQSPVGRRLSVVHQEAPVFGVCSSPAISAGAFLSLG